MDKEIGQNEAVAEMYSDFSPYPGNFIKLLNEKNLLIKKIYTAMAKRKLFNQAKSFELAQSMFANFCPASNVHINILDAGCGTGEIACQLALAFPNSSVVGADFSRGSLMWAEKLKKYLKINNVKFVSRNLAEGSIEDLGSFDLIHCRGVLHHIEHPAKALANLSTALKKEGLLWIFLYADYARHMENVTRRGIRLLFPDDRAVRERADFAEAMGYDRRTINRYYFNKIGKLIKLRWRFHKAKMNFFSLGYYEYTDRYNRNDIYDAFAHPIVHYYDADKVKELLREAKLDLAGFDLYPKSPFYQSKIQPYLFGKSMLEAMKILESFHYPQSYYLLLKRLDAADRKS